MKNKGTLKRLWKYIKRSRFWFVLSVALALVTTILTLYVPVLVGRAVDNIAGEGMVDFRSLSYVLMELGAVIGITAICQWIMNTINNRITYSVMRDIRNDAFIKMQRLPLSYIDSHQSGDITSRIISDADQMGEGLLMGFTQLFTGVVTILGTLYFMFRINVFIALVVIILTPISLFVARFIANRTYSMFSEQSVIRGEQTAYTDEIISNMKVVKAFKQEKNSADKFDEINERLRKSSLKAVFFSSITNPATRFVNNIVYAAVALIGAFIACGSGGIFGFISVGQLASFLSYANQYTKPFNEISGVFAELQNAVACTARLLELIDAEPEPDKYDAELNDVKGGVELSDVYFSYSKDKPFIDALSLSVDPGENVAIVGHTGCGKTTLINLLMRFYDVKSGIISVDGKDIRSVMRKSVRRSFGMVLQETWLKTGTVRDNILMGRTDISDDEIIAAAKAARSWSVIRRLPEGLDTVISNSGGSLSQGEKQLISITRIMLRPPMMLILDEATSSIDTRTELAIGKDFNRLMQGRTSFVVAHRLSTIRNADVILVMDSGHIVEQGSHDELIKKNGFYKRLYISRFAAG